MTFNEQERERPPSPSRSQSSQEWHSNEKSAIESDDRDRQDQIPDGIETLEKSEIVMDSSQLVSGIVTPKSVNETASGSSSPKSSSAPLRTKQQRRKENWHYFSLCFVLFLAGWDGGTLGPLILRIQTFYHASLFLFGFIEGNCYSYFCLLLGKLHDCFAHFHNELYCE